MGAPPLTPGREDQYKGTPVHCCHCSQPELTTPISLLSAPWSKRAQPGPVNTLPGPCDSLPNYKPRGPRNSSFCPFTHAGRLSARVSWLHSIMDLKEPLTSVSPPPHHPYPCILQRRSSRKLGNWCKVTVESSLTPGLLAACLVLFLGIGVSADYEHLEKV